MDNIVELYRNASVSDSVAFTEFMLSYKKDIDRIYCFFEGQEDFSYYPVRIKAISNVLSYRDFNCGGKDNVIKVRNIIKENIYYQEAKTGFFIDMDFDDNVTPNDIYITPEYSIENLYCSADSIENILVSEFKFTKESDDCCKAIEIYEQLQQNFNDDTLVFNSWLSCQSDYRKNNNTTTRLNIDKKVKSMFDNVVLPNLNGIVPLTEIKTKSDIENFFDKSPVIEGEALYNKIESFKLINQRAFFRGKFLLKFLISYLSRLQSISGTEHNPFQKSYSCSLRFESATGCSALSQYAATPNCLRLYINKYLN